VSAKRRTRALTPVGLGFRAVRGGGVVVGVAAPAGEPRLVLSSFIATAAAGDRLSLEPYHVAAGMPRGPDGGASAEAAAAVAEGRRRQGELAARGLAEIVGRLAAADCEPVAAGLLVNRAGWITDLLAHSLSAPEHPPVAEGLAVRDALRSALRRCGLAATELDEKSLRETAEIALSRPRPEIDGALRALGAAAGRPWRAEQKLSALAAWVAATERRPRNG
jgi:hypothetical protein